MGVIALFGSGDKSCTLSACEAGEHLKPPPGDGVAVTRDAAPLPGKTVPEVVSQLIWRVLGPLKGRAKSVLDWAGLGQAPPAVLREIGVRYGVSGEAVGQRIQRVAAAGVRLPLPANLEHEVTRPSRPVENHLLRTRWALLLGRPGPQRDDCS